MRITNLKFRKAAAVLAVAAMLVLSPAPGVSADHVDIHVSPAAEGTAVLAANSSSTVLATFLPDLGLASSTAATLTANATTSVTGYYGVDIESATTTGDVHWRIVVDHATEALTTSDVTITEKGYFDADGGTVADSSYPSIAVSGDLVFDGNSGWEVFSGDMFTNVDAITFASSSPAGTYTVTRTLVDNSTGASIDASFPFTVTLSAAADTTPPAAPVIVFPTDPHSTSTNPIIIGGTAEASSTISVTGGASTSTATTTGAGDWSALVSLTASSTNMLSVTAADAAGNVSASTTLSVAHFNATSTPDITPPAAPVIAFPSSPHSTTTNPIIIGGTAEASSTISITGGASTSTATTSGAGDWSASVDLTASSTNNLAVTATDASGNTSLSTMLVVTHTATSTATTTPPNPPPPGGGRGRSGDRNRGIQRAAEVTPLASVIPGQAIGLSTFQQFLLPPGQVLGASNVRFSSTLRVGSRGAEVTALQQRLTELGFYSGPITGYFGQLTKKAVQNFQQMFGLSPVGQVGPQTRQLLNSNQPLG